MQDKEFFEFVKKEDKIWVLYKEQTLLMSEIENAGRRLFVWQSESKVNLFKAHDEKNNTFRSIYISIDAIKRTWLNDPELNIQEISIDCNGLEKETLCYSKEEFVEELK